MTDQNGLGERMGRVRRRRWWLSLAVITAAAVVAGIVADTIALRGRDLMSTISPLALVVLVAAIVLAFAYGCWLMTRALDEVELNDNLWGGIAGLYVYMLGFPSWWLLWKGGVTGEPNDWVVYLVSLSVASLVYGFRRVRSI